MSIITVSSLHIYPIKSTTGINLPSANVDELGLAFDRRFVLSDLLGQFITARTEPKLCLVRTQLIETGLIISAPNMPILTLNYQDFSAQYSKITVWGDEVLGQLCSDTANKWFSEYLQRPSQLLFFGQNSLRERKPNTDKARKLAFADGYPLLLISQASLSNLNQHLENNAVPSVSMSQFRPNIVVENCLPFAEDTWQHIRIGEVEFKVSKPCERCIFTTINPTTGEKHADLQPLKTLKSFRQTKQGEVLFGQNLIPLNKGMIKHGDNLVVISKQNPPTFNKLKHHSTTIKPIEKKNTLQQELSMQLTCQQIIDETHDVKTFVFTWPNAKPIEQLAGQHINLIISMPDKEQPCCYTIASNPSAKNQIKLTIKRIPNGRVSNFFHDHLKVGDTVKAKSPSGNFHLPSLVPEKVLLLSAGSGITPMLSMLRDMVANKVVNKVVFFHSAHSENDLIARKEVAQLAKAHGNCQVIYTLTRQVRPQWQGYQGHLSEQMLANIPKLTQYEVFVCGPEGFRKSAQQHLQVLGLNKEQYHWESFGSKTTQDEQKTIIDSASPTKKKLIINFDKWRKEYQGDNQKTLLEHGEDAGLILPYSCRAGMCGNCKAQLVSGDVKESATDGLTMLERQQGFILCCSSIAQSDVVIKHNY